MSFPRHPLPDEGARLTAAEHAAIFGPPPLIPWMSWSICLLICAVYLAQLAGVRHGVDIVGTALAVSPESLARHRPWTLLTYAFAHAVPSRGLPAYAAFHLATNVVPLFCVAPALERRLGAGGLLALFCGGAIVSALTWLAWNPRPGDAMIGASGALFAVIAAGGAFGLELGRADFVFFRLPLRLDLRRATIVLCLFEAAQLFWRALPDVAHVAHLGGAAFGVAFAGLFRLVRPAAGMRVEM